jgi:hypothetical protein
MSLTTIGITFSDTSQYGPKEIEIFQSTAKQIDTHFPNQENLLINTTWFGPQFTSSSQKTEWEKLENLYKQKKQFDNLFLLAVIDPVYIDDSQIEHIEQQLSVTKTFQIGMWENSKFEWNFHAAVTPLYMQDYSSHDVEMISTKYKFLCYQRKPREHRVELTNLLIQTNLISHGMVTLGAGNEEDKKNWSSGMSAPTLLAPDDPPENYKLQFKVSDIITPGHFANIPNDVVSLGKLDIWKNHFLNIVSETEFNEWHRRFISEKTWKPMIGMRPFIIHGQIKIYQWLQNQGFRTFGKYWPHIDIETSQDQTGNVFKVIEFITEKPESELFDMYTDMLPDLQHNRDRYFEFAKEQQYKINHLFE